MASVANEIKVGAGSRTLLRSCFPGQLLGGVAEEEAS